MFCRLSPVFIATVTIPLRYSYCGCDSTFITGYYLVIGDVSTKKSPTMNAVLSLVNGLLRKDDKGFAGIL